MFNESKYVNVPRPSVDKRMDRVYGTVYKLMLHVTTQHTYCAVCHLHRYCGMVASICIR